MCKPNRFQKKLGICFLVFTVLCEILVNLSYERGVLAVQHYAGAIVFAYTGMMLLSGYVKWNLDEKIAALYPAWYLASRILLHELYLDDSFYNFCSLCLVYVLAFPFARWMADEEKKTGLQITAALFAGVFGILAWVGVYAMLSNQNIVLPYVKTMFTLDGKRLGMGTHPNVTAGIFFSAFVLNLWLAVSLRKRWIVCPALILGLGLYLAIGMTDSRMVMLQTSVLASALAFFGCQKWKIPSKMIRYGIAFVGAAATLVVTYFSFPVMLDLLNTLTHNVISSAIAEATNQLQQEQLTAGRSVLEGVTSIYGRDVHYRGAFRLIAEHPDVLLRGTRMSDMSMVMNYLNGVNTHNAYLQSLVNTGVIALAVALWFTVRTCWIAIKVVFYHEKRSTFADKVLAVIPLTLLLNAFTESYVFTELTSYYAFIYFLTLGYAIAHERTLRAKQ